MNPARSTWVRRGRGRALLVVLLALVVLAVSACSDAHTEEDKYRADNGSNPSLLRVYVNKEEAPLIQSLIDEYTKKHRGVSFILVTQKSEASAEQVQGGSRPDIWADLEPVLQPFASDARAVGPPTTYAANQLVWIVAKDNPLDLQDLDVFEADRDPQSGLCKSTLPCGIAARAMLVQQGVNPEPDFETGTAASSIGTVVDGKVYTTIVYRTDTLTTKGQYSTVPLPDPSSQQIAHQMLRMTDNPSGLDFVTWAATSPDAHAVLKPLGLYDPDIA